MSLFLSYSNCPCKLDVTWHPFMMRLDGANNADLHGVDSSCLCIYFLSTNIPFPLQRTYIPNKYLST